MKTSTHFLQWLTVVLLLAVNVTNVMAVDPPSNTGDYSVCLTGIAEPYRVEDVATSTFTWSILPGVSGTDWDLSSTSSNNNTIEVIWKTPGTYTLQVIETSNFCDGVPKTIQVTVNPLPTASIASNNGPQCYGEDATFTLTGTADAVVTYKINAGANQTVTLNGTGAATITITAATADQVLALVSVQNTTTTCIQTLTETSTVTVNPLPTVSIASNNGPQCYGEDATFTLTGTADAVVTYKINAGANQTVTLNGTGAATITITAATADQVLALVSVQNTTTTCIQAVIGTSTVTVNPLPTASIAGNNGSQCYGENAIFTLSGTPNAKVTYTINGVNQIITLDGTGAGTVTITGATANQKLDLVSVLNTTTSCSQAVIGTSTVIINPQVNTSPIYHN